MGEEIYYNMHEEGGALIKEITSGYELYEIPIYGGKPRFITFCATLEIAKSIADKWT